jgi:mannose-6-phosphate isomerase
MMKVIPKPWGQEEVLHIDDKYLMKRLTMKAGHRCSLQFHERKNETVYVISGRLTILAGPSKDALEKKILGPGEFMNIPTRLVHRMEAAEDCVYLEASTPELEDVVRISDDYSRS